MKKRPKFKPKAAIVRAPSPANSRRSPFRVPFVRRGTISFSDGAARGTFIANINEYGAYLADEEMPKTGQGMTLRFVPPGSEVEIEATGAVAWLNPKQQHPVHSLPPGYGVQFDPLRESALQQITAIVQAFLERHRLS